MFNIPFVKYASDALKTTEDAHNNTFTAFLMKHMGTPFIPLPIKGSRALADAVPINRVSKKT